MESGTYKLVQLASGSWSLHSTKYKETFHPVIGPVAEAEALYLKQVRLFERLQEHDGEFVIWDIGLGAAANVLTILQAVRSLPVRIRVISFDYTLEPLSFALGNKESLRYFDGFEDAVQTLITKHAASFQVEKAQVEWSLHLADFPEFVRSETMAQIPKPYLILFDAFSPARNPAMWSLPLFSDLYRLLDPARSCLMPTYSRSTMLRVTLLLAGFFVGVGHATGEKEETTIAANDLSSLSEPLGAAWLERAERSTSAEPMAAPVYAQRPLSTPTLARLKAHPQFSTLRLTN